MGTKTYCRKAQRGHYPKKAFCLKVDTKLALVVLVLPDRIARKKENYI